MGARFDGSPAAPKKVGLKAPAINRQCFFFVAGKRKEKSAGKE